MARDPLRIGMIGCGMIGQIHADGLSKLQDDGEIEAVMAADPLRPARLVADRRRRGGEAEAKGVTARRRDAAARASAAAKRSTEPC